MIANVLIALLVVTLNFSRQIANMITPYSGCMLHWRFIDGVALIAVICIFTLIALAVHRMIVNYHFVLLYRIFFIGFMQALFSGICFNLSNVIILPTWVFPSIWLLLATCAIIFHKKLFQFLPLIKKICLCFSPLSFILFGQLLFASEWGVPTEKNLFQLERTTQFSNAENIPVYYFVFDEWSFHRSVDKNYEFLPSLSNFSALSEQSVMLLHSYSRYPDTEASLPAMIYQRDDIVHIDGNGIYFVKDGNKLPSDKETTIFTAMKNRKYSTALVGFHFPYRRVVGDQVDYVRAFSSYPSGPTFYDRMVSSVFRNTHNILLERFFYAGHYSRYWHQMNKEFLSEVLMLIDSSPERFFGFIHWPLPHFPFVINSDGSYFGSYARLGGKRNGTPEDYQRHLIYLDVVVGKVVEHLKRAGKFDKSLLIFTSDHGWRGDERFLIDADKNPRQRVPLLIKLPYQDKSVKIEREMYNNHLQPLIENVLSGDTSIQGLNKVLDN